MAAARAKRRKKTKKKNSVVKIAAVTALLAVAALGVYFAVACFRSDTALELKKLSYPREYSEYVDKAARDYNLEPALIYAVIRTESGFDSDAESVVGACGVMQVMPSSFEWIMNVRGTGGEHTTEDLFNPEVCIDYGSWLLRYFYDYFGSEQCAIAAYNAGFTVDEWLGNPEYSHDGMTLDVIPYPETSEYVKKVTSAKQAYLELYY